MLEYCCMYKYIFCDLDRTLLDDAKNIPEINIKAINEAKKKGVTFMFSTGRVPFCFEEYGKYLDISSYSACNGAVISVNGKIIRNEYMNKEVARELIEYGIKHDLNERIFTKDRMYLANADKVSKIMLNYNGSVELSHEETRKLADEKEIYKVCFCSDEREALNKAQKDLLGDKMPLEACFSAPLFLEFANYGCNKGQGILNFCKLTGENIEDIIAIGDNENDYSMLKIAGISACPSNSIPEIKKIADYVTKKDNNEGAVAEVIDHYIFGK